MDRMEPTVWPCINYRDARAAIRFLTEAFGFVETLVVPGETDDVVVHAELRWPEGGGVMLGIGRPRRQRVLAAADELRVGVRRHADPHGVYDRAIAAGATDRPRDARRGLRLDRLQRRATPRTTSGASAPTTGGDAGHFRELFAGNDREVVTFVE